MKILVLASTYPYANNPSAGIYNERSAIALQEHCDLVQVLAPKPLSAAFLSVLSPRWKNYADMAAHEVREGISIFRPAYLQIPHVTPAFWLDPGIYLWCGRHARSMHRKTVFDAILAFGLASVGGLAWRLAKDLGIPAAGWATGSDVRAPASNAHAHLVTQALDRLDLVIYQSQDLRSCGAKLLRVPLSELSPNRHIVLPRGIPEPPALPVVQTRERVRNEWNIRPDQTLVLFVGRIVRGKGVFDLVEAMRNAAARHPNLTCVLVGSVSGFDDTPAIQEKLDQDPFLKKRVRVLPACDPSTVWELLCGADIFAFPSYSEGMPNALLEAMVMGVASVAYAIPPVVELDGGFGGVTLVPTGNTGEFAEALLRLCIQSGERKRAGKSGEVRVRQHFMTRKTILEVVRRLKDLAHRNSKMALEESLSSKSSTR